MSENPQQDLNALCDTLIDGCRILDHQGIVDGSGHLSFRVPGTDRYVLPARQAPGQATPASLMTLDAEGRVVDGSGTVPLEWPIHGRIYRERPDVGAIMHSHSRMSRLFSVSRHPLQPVFGIAVPWWSSAVPVYRGCGPVQSADEGDELAGVLADGPAALLRAHGNAVVGGGIEECVVRSIILEQTAQTVHLGLCQGGLDPLTDGEIERWDEATQFGAAKHWRYYRAKAIGVETSS